MQPSKPRYSRRELLTGSLQGAAGLLAGAAAEAADWPGWRGPARNGISSESTWKHQWSGAGPRQLWQAQVGEGWSAATVAGGRVYTMGNGGGSDQVLCLDANTGKVVWKHSYRCAAGDYGGPRATPVVAGKQVFTLSREGHAYCLDAATGRVVWGKDLRRETRAELPRWGFGGSPLVHGSRVIYNVGAAGTGLDRATGRPVWKSSPNTAGYSSPLPFAVGAQRGVAIFAASGLVAVDPNTGRTLWSHPWDTSYDVNAADPIFSGDTVFISSNYNRGCALLRIAGSRPAPLWENRNMRNHFNSCVLVGGALFGNDEGSLKCIDHRTGAERWRSRGLGKGGLIAAGNRLIALTERGELKVISATPQAYRELASARVMGGTCWTHPVLANGRIYCRNHEGNLVCLNVA